MSAPDFPFFARQETLDGKQEALREVLNQAADTGTQKANGLFSYGLPPACAHYLDIALSDIAIKLDLWARLQRKRITSTTILDKHPETFRLEQGHPIPTPLNSLAVVLPLYGDDDAVTVEVATNDAEVVRAAWPKNAALLVPATHEFSVAEGSARFIYVLIRIQDAD